MNRNKKRMVQHSVVITFLFLLLQLMLVHHVCNGWGHEGHEIVGNLAWMLISQKTRDSIVTILNLSESHNDNHYYESKDNDESSSPLGLIASWADSVKYTSEYHWSGSLHYIDIQDKIIINHCAVVDPTNMTSIQNNYCHFNYTRDCYNDICVAGAIVNYSNALLIISPENTNGIPTTTLDNKKKKTSEIYNGLKFVANQRKTLQMTTTIKEDDASSCIGKKNCQHQRRHLRRSKLLSERSTTDNSDSYHNETTITAKLRKESLMFLTHFIGDIHQPLHASRTSDIGGNTISVHFLKNTEENNNNNNLSTNSISRHSGLNLHAVWDDSIIEEAIQMKYSKSRVLFEQDLYTYIIDQMMNNSDEFEKTWLVCPDGSNKECTKIWGDESLQNALMYSYRNVDGTEIISGTILSNEYYITRLPIVMESLAKAGLRLAITLDFVLNS